MLEVSSILPPIIPEYMRTRSSAVLMASVLLLLLVPTAIASSVINGSVSEDCDGCIHSQVFLQTQRVQNNISRVALHANDAQNDETENVQALLARAVEAPEVAGAREARLEVEQKTTFVMSPPLQKFKSRLMEIRHERAQDKLAGRTPAPDGIDWSKIRIKRTTNTPTDATVDDLKAELHAFTELTPDDVKSICPEKHFLAGINEHEQTGDVVAHCKSCATNCAECSSDTTAECSRCVDPFALLMVREDPVPSFACVKECPECYEKNIGVCRLDTACQKTYDDVEVPMVGKKFTNKFKSAIKEAPSLEQQEARDSNAKDEGDDDAEIPAQQAREMATCRTKDECSAFCATHGGRTAAHEASWSNIPPGCVFGGSTYCWWNINIGSTAALGARHRLCPSQQAACRTKDECTAFCATHGGRTAHEASWSNIPPGCVFGGSTHCWWNINIDSTATLGAGHRLCSFAQQISCTTAADCPSQYSCDTNVCEMCADIATEGSCSTDRCAWNGAMCLAPVWSVESGQCTTVGSCVQSPNYPSNYGDSQSCSIIPGSGFKIIVKAFSTESLFDTLYVNGDAFHGSTGPMGAVPTEPITWISDRSTTSSGWELCSSSCTNTNDCPSGYTCDALECKVSCTTASDCESKVLLGHVCDGGACKVAVCSNVMGGTSSTYPCTCGTTTAATTQCAASQLCTASNDDDGMCQAACRNQDECSAFCATHGGSTAAHEASWSNIPPGCVLGDSTHCWWNINIGSTAGLGAGHRLCPWAQQLPTPAPTPAPTPTPPFDRVYGRRRSVKSHRRRRSRHRRRRSTAQDAEAEEDETSGEKICAEKIEVIQTELNEWYVECYEKANVPKTVCDSKDDLQEDIDGFQNSVAKIKMVSSSATQNFLRSIEGLPIIGTIAGKVRYACKKINGKAASAETKAKQFQLKTKKLDPPCKRVQEIHEKVNAALHTAQGQLDTFSENCGCNCLLNLSQVEQALVTSDTYKDKCNAALTISFNLPTVNFPSLPDWLDNILDFIADIVKVLRDVLTKRRCFDILWWEICYTVQDVLNFFSWLIGLIKGLVEGIVFGIINAILSALGLPTIDDIINMIVNLIPLDVNWPDIDFFDKPTWGGFGELPFGFGPLGCVDLSCVADHLAR